MRNFAIGFIGGILILPIGWMGHFAFGLSQIRADAKPSGLETAILQSTVRASVRRGAAAIPNPPAENEETLVAGGKLYMAGCAGCHGELGKPFQEDQDLFPPAPQLPHVGTQYSERELYWIVKHGIRMTGMSAYGPFYSEKQLWELVAFLRQINKLPPGVFESIQAKKVPQN
jgi:mono/diheme cytochrome c family protein